MGRESHLDLIEGVEQRVLLAELEDDLDDTAARGGSKRVSLLSVYTQLRTRRWQAHSVASISKLMSTALDCCISYNEITFGASECAGLASEGGAFGRACTARCSKEELQ